MNSTYNIYTYQDKKKRRLAVYPLTSLFVVSVYFNVLTFDIVMFQNIDENLVYSCMSIILLDVF